METDFNAIPDSGELPENIIPTSEEIAEWVNDGTLKKELDAATGYDPELEA